MSEYGREITTAVSVAIIGVIVLAVGTIYLIPNQPTGPTATAGVGQPLCGQNEVDTIASSQIEIAYGTAPPEGRVCLAFVFTNTSNETIYPMEGLIKVTDKAGDMAFNATVVSLGASAYGLAPGKTWEGSAYWNISPSAPAGYTISISVHFVNGQNKILIVTAQSGISLPG